MDIKSKLLTVAVLVLSSSASAAPIYYTDRASFDVANPSLAFENFQSQSAGEHPVVTGNGYSLDSFKTLPDNTEIHTSKDIWITDYNFPGNQYAYGNQSGDAPLELTFEGSGVGAVGLDLLSFWTPGTSDIALYGGDAGVPLADAPLLGTYNISLQETAWTFWGVRSDTPITRLQISANYLNPFEGIDNMSYGTISAVPLPAAIWLFGSGLLGLIGLARRKK